MAYNMFIDDERDPKDVTWIRLPEVKWVVLRTYAEVVEFISRFGMPDVVSFDHDLGSEPKTGYDCAKYIYETCFYGNQPFPDYYVHSMNPIGAKNIHGFIYSICNA